MKKAADSQRGPIRGRTACRGRSARAPAGAAEASALPIPNFKAAVCRCVLLCSGALLIGGCATGSKETVVEKIGAVAGGTVTITTIPVGFPAFSLAAGEGAVWVAGRKCVKIDPGSNRVVGAIPAASVCNIAVGDGAVWAVKIALVSHELRRIDTTTGGIVAKIPGITGWPVLGGGSLWVHAPGKVLRIDPQTNRVLATIPTEGVGVRIVVGEGAVWVLEQKSYFPGSEISILRIDPSTDRVTDTVHLGPQGCAGLAVGEGAVWVAQSGFSGGIRESIAPGGDHRGKILRIDPKSNRIVRAIPLPDQPMSVVAGGGWVWVSTAFGHVVRIDPRTNQVVEDILIRGRTYKQGLFRDTALLTGASLWLGGLPGGEVYRIDFPGLAVSQRHPTAELNVDTPANKPGTDL